MASKNWVFTINNYDDKSMDWVRVVKYAVWQEEVAPSTGTPHIQGYCQLGRKQRMPWLKKNLHPTAYWAERKGTHEQAREYCTKEESRKPGTQFKEMGEACKDYEGQGKRTDLAAYKEAIDEGKTELECCEGFFGVWARYPRLYKDYKFLKFGKQQRNWVTELFVYWGPPGTGKSRRALHEAGPDAFWLRKQGGGQVWWDGYEGQENVVIDEFYGWIPRDLMCRLADRYPLMVDTKGGAAVFLAKKIWITSNTEPEQWWPKVGLGPVERRITRRETMVMPSWMPPVPKALPAIPLAPEMGLMTDEILPPEEDDVVEVPDYIAPDDRKRKAIEIEEDVDEEENEVAEFWAHPDMKDVSLSEGQKMWEAYQSWKRARYGNNR